MPISRKSLIPFSFENKEDFIKLLDYFPYDTITSLDIYEIMEDILINKDVISTKNSPFESYEDYLKFIINDIVPNIDEKKLNKNRLILKNYFLNFYVGKSATFDIGYSGKPENTITKLLDKEIDTYFVHFNDNNAYYYSNSANYNLSTFYDYKPKFTGLLREYMFSDLNGSCKKYLCKDDTITIEYDDVEIDYYEKWILDIIQRNSVELTKDILDLFADNLDEIYFPKYYMSIPYEYFLHLSGNKDRLVFQNLMFENTVNDIVSIQTIWEDIVNTSGEEPINHIFVPPTYESITTNFYQLNVANRNKLVKLIYYLMYDRVAFKAKLREKFGEKNIIIRGMKKCYHIIKR